VEPIEFHVELKIDLKSTLNTLFKGVFVSPTDWAPNYYILKPD